MRIHEFGAKFSYKEVIKTLSVIQLLHFATITDLNEVFKQGHINQVRHRLDKSAFSFSIGFSYLSTHPMLTQKQRDE